MCEGEDRRVPRQHCIKGKDRGREARLEETQGAEVGSTTARVACPPDGKEERC